MTWNEMKSQAITADDIERARAAGACPQSLCWAEAGPRTWGDVATYLARPEWIGWYACHAATPAQLDACIEGTDAGGRCLIGCYRDDLTEAQLDACIAGTTAYWRCLIGCERKGLTAARARRAE